MLKKWIKKLLMKLRREEDLSDLAAKLYKEKIERGDL